MTDYSKNSAEILIELINTTNGSKFKYGDIAFSDPQPIQSLGAENTSLDATGVKSNGYMGAVNLIYRRVNLVEILHGPSDRFSKNHALRISDLIQAINARFGINLQSSDYVDQILPAFPPNATEVSFVVNANPTSLVWTGFVTLVLTV